MPKGPPGQRPPSDVIGAAAEVMPTVTGEATAEVMPTATGEAAAEVMPTVTGEAAEDAVSPASAAAQLGKLGGAARARNLTPEKRTEIAKKAAARRWEKK